MAEKPSSTLRSLAWSTICNTVTPLDVQHSTRPNVWIEPKGCSESKHGSEANAHPQSSKAFLLLGNGDVLFIQTCGVCNRHKRVKINKADVLVVPGFVPDGIVPDVPDDRFDGWHDRKPDGTYALRTSKREAAKQ